MTTPDRTGEPDASLIGDAIEVVSTQTRIRAALHDLAQSPLDVDRAGRVVELLGRPATRARDAFDRLLGDEPNAHSAAQWIDQRIPDTKPRLKVVDPSGPQGVVSTTPQAVES